jgi:hypothetical protein
MRAFLVWWLVLVPLELIAQSTDRLIGNFFREDESGFHFVAMASDGSGTAGTVLRSGAVDVVMTFDWTATRETLTQKNLRWSGDGRNYKKSPDVVVEYRFSNGIFETLAPGNGEWLGWERMTLERFEERIRASRESHDKAASRD